MNLWEVSNLKSLYKNSSNSVDYHTHNHLHNLLQLQLHDYP